MYRAYLVPDATDYNNRSAMYQAKLLLWDPYSESDAYAVIGPKIKSELNKAESFQFTILPANVCYSQIKKRLSVIIVYDDDEWIFEGVVSDCPKDFYKQMKVTCSGPLSYLCDSIQAPDEKNEVVIPKASGNIYVPVPLKWYNNANPHDQGWYIRSSTVGSDGKYTYTLTNDTKPKSSKTYYYISSGDNMNHSGTTIVKSAAIEEKINAHLDRLLEVHNSQVDAFKKIYLGTCVNDTTVHEFKTSNYRDTWSAIKNDIIESYGRYITITMDNNFVLKFNYLELNDMDSHSTPESAITFTENMLEMTESDDSDDDIFTVLVPIGKNNITISGLSGHSAPEHNDNRAIDPYVPDASNWGGNKRYIIVSKNAVKTYGYIVKTKTFNDAETPDDLWTASVKYIKNNFDDHTEYEVKGIDAHVLNSSKPRIVVGKKCRIKSGWHGVDEKDLYVISSENDLSSPDNDTYRIGIPTSDREATNKSLTSQTTATSSASRSGAAAAAAGVNTVSSWLENYFSENEGWLELHNKFRNQVESDNGMFITRFEQDEEHLNLMAQKIFGVAGSDDVANQDAGWILIPKPPYRRVGQGVEDYYENSSSNSTTYKVPNEHNWYEKVNGVYVKSTQDTRVTQAQVNDSNVNFYIMRLATRYSDLDVGPGGIKARVDGNYDTSTYCSSWIHTNEDAILALTGHLYVDEDGHVHITSGAGMRTDHEEDDTTPQYIEVQRSMYSQNPNPWEKKWYERKLESDGSWKGQGKSDYNTNDSYYDLTGDTVVNRSKYYYYKSNVRETFVAEYGVYDQDNLTAGVLARMINNPTYHKVSDAVVTEVANRAGNPSQQGWYVYEETKGTFGLTLDQFVPRGSHGEVINRYYYVINNSENTTDIWGEHIVVGRTAGYSGLDAATQAKINRYIEDRNLNGTVTEFASDVVTMNILLAKYIEADEIVANTSLWAEHIHAGTVHANGILIGVGEKLHPEGWDVSDAVRMFGDPTYDGDNVTIPYWRLTSLISTPSGPTSPDGTITFTKPASLGSVTWSSGNKTLTAKTVGGRNFLVGQIKAYVPSGQDEAIAMNNAAYLEGETSGYNQVYGMYYTKKDANGNDLSQKVILFKTPKDRYDDGITEGISQAKSKFGLFGPGEAKNITQDEAVALSKQSALLSYGTIYEVYKTYDGDKLGDRTLFRTPTDRYNEGYNAGAASATHSISLTSDGYSDSDPGSNYVELTSLLTDIKNAESDPDKKWVYFHVSCGDNAIKYYKMKV